MHVQFMHALALPLAQCRAMAKELHETNLSYLCNFDREVIDQVANIQLT